VRTPSLDKPLPLKSHVYVYGVNNSDTTALIDPNSVIKAGMVDVT